MEFACGLISSILFHQDVSTTHREAGGCVEGTVTVNYWYIPEYYKTFQRNSYFT